jgi:hypothetical protein
MFGVHGRVLGAIAALAIALTCALGGAPWPSRTETGGYLPVCSVPTSSVTLAKSFSAR